MKKVSKRLNIPSNIKKTGIILVFLAPSFIGFSVFTLIPIVYSLGLTFVEWDLITDPVYIGFSNYVELFADPKFYEALKHTLVFTLGYLPLVISISLGLSVLLNQKIPGVKFFRTAFFIPVISAWVAVALLWKWIFNPQYGLMNFALSLIGIAGPAWLFDPDWAMFAIIITSVWKDIGFLIVIFLAGLQGVPAALYEAAKIDGAGGWRIFFKITLPLLSPTMFFALIISLIHSFEVFDQVWIMTEGGPAGATSVIVEQIVKNAFRYGRMGYATTISWVLFGIIFIITSIQMKVQKAWVVYD